MLCRRVEVEPVIDLSRGNILLTSEGELNLGTPLLQLTHCPVRLVAMEEHRLNTSFKIVATLPNNFGQIKRIFLARTRF